MVTPGRYSRCCVCSRSVNVLNITCFKTVHLPEKFLVTSLFYIHLLLSSQYLRKFHVSFQRYIGGLEIDLYRGSIRSSPCNNVLLPLVLVQVYPFVG